ncbi:MAG: hypothetical protein H7Y43_14230 [Akkermansiaceae bacterium]|nr:hypothetical protein [Verrucomicrobiales bacterium]
MATNARKRDLWLLALRQPSIWARAFKFGFTAGLLQAAVNQGDLWLRHAVGPAVIIKTIVSPLIGLTLVLLTSAATWVQKSVEEKYEQ